MTNTPDRRLQRLLGNPALDVVRQRLRHHYEHAEPDAPPPTRLRLSALDPAAHAALCQLSGRPSRTARSMTLDLADLDARLRESGLADSLRDALERLDGPIVARGRLRRELLARWSALTVPADRDPRLQAWLATPAASTLLKRLGRGPERAAGLLADADRVLRRLPAAGLTRSQLAAATLGDAHALDAGRPAATLALAAWRHHERLQQNPPTVSRPADTPADDQAVAQDEERVRDVWARAGVLVSELARPALFLNLPTAAGAEDWWTSGEPAYLPLRQLLRRPPAWRVTGCHIFVCENPDIVAIAADRLGAACAPLVCTDGMPAAAQRALLDQLAAAGAQLHYHGDYDWPGLGIGNFVLRTWRAAAWRFSTIDYVAAIARAATRPNDLGAGMIVASWDRQLGPAMQAHRMAIAEEAVVESLLEDLAEGASCGRPE